MDVSATPTIVNFTKMAESTATSTGDVIVLITFGIIILLFISIILFFYKYFNN